MPDLNQVLRSQLVELLSSANAHASLDQVLANFPPEHRGTVPKGLPYSAWQLLEHIRIAQKDILDFSTNEDGHYRELKWPDEYWPKDPNPPSRSAWDESVKQIRSDRERFEELLQNPKTDLAATFPWGDGQNLIREALLIADHATYHTGELLVLRRLLGTWNK
jgi:uncharacterized damage-inducible protein DinB